MAFQWVKNRSKSERQAASLWETNPWSNFCDPYWELICHKKMTPGYLGNIWTTGNRDRDTPPWATWQWNYLVFSPADGEASWLVLPSLVSLLSGNRKQCNQKTPISVSSRWQVKLEKAKMGKDQYWLQLPSAFVSLSQSQLIWCFRFIFNQLNRKRWGARLANVIKYLAHKALSLWHHY